VILSLPLEVMVGWWHSMYFVKIALDRLQYGRSTYKCNVETCSRNHCCRGKTI